MTASRLYLIIDVATVNTLSEEAIEKVLAAGDIACIRLQDAGATGGLASAADRVIPIASRFDIAVVLENDVDLVVQKSADGVHLNADNADLTEVRSSIRDDAIIGVEYTGSRHHAMEAGQTGADYIAFDPDRLDEAEWWAEVFEIPCVAEAADDESIASIAGSPIEFLALRVSPDDPTCAQILAQLELATRCIEQGRVKERA